MSYVGRAATGVVVGVKPDGGIDLQLQVTLFMIEIILVLVVLPLVG